MKQITKAEFEKRVQRAQKAIAAIAKNVSPEMVSADLTNKVARFLTTQVDDLQRDLIALSKSGVKRGVFSLDAPLEEPMATRFQKALERSPPHPAGPDDEDSFMTEDDLEPAKTDIPRAKVSSVVGKIAPPDVAREVMKNAEAAPERVRVFGAKKPVPEVSEVDFQEE